MTYRCFCWYDTYYGRMQMFWRMIGHPFSEPSSWLPGYRGFQFIFHGSCHLMFYLRSVEICLYATSVADRGCSVAQQVVTIDPPLPDVPAGVCQLYATYCGAHSSLQQKEVFSRFDFLKCVFITFVIKYRLSR